MERLQIVGLGATILDILVRLKDIPTWEKPARATAITLAGGGPVATAMVASSRLGARVGFIGVAGNDEAADFKVGTLAKEGLELSHLIRRPIPEDHMVVVLVNEKDGERIFLGNPQGRKVGPLRPEELDRDYITQADYLHLDGGHREAGEQAAIWMHEAGKKVVYDGSRVNPDARLQVAGLMKHVDYLIGGSGFVPALTGIKDVWEAGKAALELGPSVVVQTEGSDGSYTVTKDAQFHVPAFKVDVVDTTGCGDVFHGAYIAGLLQGWDLKRVAQFASAVSAIKATKLSGRAGIPTFDQTIAFLRERGVEGF